MQIGIITSPQSWFKEYAQHFQNELCNLGYKTRIYYDHNEINYRNEVLFILSYFKIIPKKVLELNRYNLVIHASDLPEGKGWSPTFWQILEGKTKIPIVLFDANEKVDNGDIFLKSYIHLKGDELNKEIRKMLASKMIDMCYEFLENKEKIKPKKQVGKETFYNKRTPKDSELDVDKTIREQFNLLRIVNNNEFPAFFYLKGQKYILKIYKG